MVKRREPKASSVKAEPTSEQIEAFASGAERGKPETQKANLDPEQPRKFKTISVPFNEYEYTQLLKGVELTGRTKLNFMRHAMLSLVKALQEKA